MALDLCEAGSLLARDIREEERTRAAQLDAWAPRAPRLSPVLAEIAQLDPPRRRRTAFWELLAEMEDAERTQAMLSILGSAHREEAEGLRLLFTFLVGRPTTFLYPEQLGSLRHSLRLAARLLFHQPPSHPDELAWLEEFRAGLPSLGSLAALREVLAKRGQALREFLALDDAMPLPLPPALDAQLRLEGRAASLRGRRLVESVGDYDPQAVARLLPMVVALDEWQGDLTALADKGAKALKHPLQQYLEADCGAWRAGLAAGGVAETTVARWIQWMEKTELVGSEPAAWVAILRTFGEKKYRKTLHAALVMPRFWRQRSLGLTRRPPSALVPRKAVQEAGGIHWVDLDFLKWAQWVDPDGLPATPAQWQQEDCPLLYLRSRLQDDHFCERILDNEQWVQRQGVVEAIAMGSRSLKILLRIARDRKLHTGAANRRVPISLLMNPAGVPLSALRPFLGLHYISRHELQRLARGGPDVREEISRESRSVLKYL
jgi:hypothetical protein